MKRLNLLALCLLCCFWGLQAQILGPHFYLQGTYLEAGLSERGVLGTDSTIPPGYHATSAKLGWVADPDEDGWTLGTPPQCGDAVIPGYPQESFGIRLNGTELRNDRGALSSGSFDIPGSIVSSSTGSNPNAVWRGSHAGLVVSQTTRVKENGHAIYFTVELCNRSSSTIDSIYYARNIDPDQEVDLMGSFSTFNSIQAQGDVDDLAAVSAEGLTHGCFVGLIGASPDSRAGIYGTLNLPMNLARAYHGGDPLQMDSGSLTADRSINILHFFGSLAPGECKCLQFVYFSHERSYYAFIHRGSGFTVFANGTDMAPHYSDSFDLGDTVKLMASGIGPFVWSTGDTADSICVVMDSSMVIELVDLGACAGDELRIELHTRDGKGCCCEIAVRWTWSVDDCDVCFEPDLDLSHCTRVARYEWDFGDGHKDTSARPCHRYDSLGAYNVTLTVWATDGTNTCFGGKTQVVEPEACCDCEVEANFKYCVEDCDYCFEPKVRHSECTEIIGYRWSFGDGTYSRDKNPCHKYRKDGRYTVRLQVAVRDTADSTNTCYDVIEKTIMVDGCEEDPCCSIEGHINLRIDTDHRFVVATPRFDLDSCTRYVGHYWILWDGTRTDATTIAKRVKCGTKHITLVSFGVGKDGDTCEHRTTRYFHPCIKVRDEREKDELRLGRMGSGSPLKAIPNPSDGFYTIEHSVASGESLTYRVFTKDGRLVGEMELISNGKSFDLDLSYVGSGLYILNLWDGKEHRQISLAKN